MGNLNSDPEENPSKDDGEEWIGKKINTHTETGRTERALKYPNAPNPIDNPPQKAINDSRVWFLIEVTKGSMSNAGSP